ncbi:MAG: hypothetical protein WBO08_16180, partial [Mycobacterium sp.]
MAVAIGVGAAVATTPAVAWADGPDGQTQTHKSADTGSKRESKSESKSGSESGSKSGSKSESKSESKSKSESGSESESKSGSESESESSGAKDGATPASRRPDPADVIRRSVERSLDNVRNAIAGAVRGSGGTDASPDDDPDEPPSATPQTGKPPETGPTLNTEDENDNGRSAGFDRLKARSSKPALDEARTADVPRLRARLASADTAATPKPESVLRAVQQSLSTLTKLPTNPLTTIERKPFLSAAKLPDPVGGQTEVVAPIDMVGKVLNAVVAPFFNGTPG